MDIQPNSIKVQATTGQNVIYFIPRIYFKFRLKYGVSYDMIRMQFPLRLAYAFTFNKAQGQTFTRVLVDVRKDIFAHGFLYVAMSRVKKYDSICLYVDNTNSAWLNAGHNREFHDTVTVKNIVYKDILL